MKLRRESDPSLAEFLQGLGEDASASADTEEQCLQLQRIVMFVLPQIQRVRLSVVFLGTEVEKKGQEGDWIQVDYDGQTGYVYSGLLE